jgi:4'-phosphopantetheinyl transferase
MSDFSTWEPRPERLELAPDEIHVWRADLEREEVVLRQLEETLSTDEKARANRFFFQRDRSHFIATRGMLRELLGRYVNRAPRRIEFGYGPQGKPTLRTGPAEQSIQFNISHSNSMALLVFTVGRHLGVDVELVRHFDGEEIAERYFSPQEVMELRRLPAALQEEGFFFAGHVKKHISKQGAKGCSSRSRAFTFRSRRGSLSDCKLRTEWIGVCVLFVRTLSTWELWSEKAKIGSCVAGTRRRPPAVDCSHVCPAHPMGQPEDTQAVKQHFHQLTPVIQDRGRGARYTFA